MKKPHAFRPVAGELLETRAVPTGGFNNYLASLIGVLPAVDAQAVAKAFGTFEQTYLQDVHTILLPSGTTNPSANRSAFDTAIGTALGTLNSSIDTAIQNLSTASTLDTTIQGELLGTGTGALQATLAAITTPASTGFRDVRMFDSASSRAIEASENQVVGQVQSAPAPTGTITVATVQGDLMQIDAAFQTFIQAYNNDIQTILLPSGTTNPSANRPAFDTAVGTALGTLNSSIGSALSNLPSSVSSSLSTTIQNDLLTGTSTTGTSLQARLAAIPSPTSTHFFSTLMFRFQSFFRISQGEGKVFQDVISAVSTYNKSL
jgi:hypothetical protein